MRKLALIALIAMTTLSGCIEEGADLTNNHNVITICLDGVEYWMISPEKQSQTLAPRVDAVTLEFVRCK